MITKFDQFYSINENWQAELKEGAIELIKDYITPDEIEDYFLDLRDIGFTFNTDLLIGYGEKNSFRTVDQKRDIVQNQCYPCYRVRVNKDISSSNTLNSTKKKLEFFTNVVNKYQLAFDRISSIHDTEIVAEQCDITNNGIRLEFKLKINVEIPKNYGRGGGQHLGDISPKRKALIEAKMPYYGVMAVLTSNKIFNIIKGVQDKSVTFEVIESYNNPAVDMIVDRIFSKFSDSIHLRKISDKRYEITIIKK